jgi:hypothetical protein
MIVQYSVQSDELLLYDSEVRSTYLRSNYRGQLPQSHPLVFGTRLYRPNSSSKIDVRRDTEYGVQ